MERHPATLPGLRSAPGVGAPGAFDRVSRPLTGSAHDAEFLSTHSGNNRLQVPRASRVGALSCSPSCAISAQSGEAGPMAMLALFGAGGLAAIVFFGGLTALQVVRDLLTSGGF